MQYKQNSRLDEKRKKAMDLHLNFIVNQTEQYSNWLSEGLTNQSNSGSLNTTPDPSIAGDGNLMPIYGSCGFSVILYNVFISMVTSQDLS